MPTETCWSSAEPAEVGIWPETYRVRTSDIGTIYGNLPPLGLGAALGTVPLQRGRDSAAARTGARDVTLWRDRAAITAARKAGAQPAALALAERIGAEHSHDVFTVEETLDA